MSENLRIDKFLWAVRLFKTRNLAQEKCNKGHVLIKDLAVKPSKFVKIGDIILIKNPPIIRTYKILKLIDKRVSAKLVPDLIVETTPQSELDKLKNIETAFIVRDKGSGRPTKKERRLINKIKDDNL
ncbi:MAG: RNA-binding S4 domain-containing protein [Bacteroidales bacterium]|jgi:ribosome-associated heat shock protein Hsp15|nr:RNA-binding S4 domain-containing protein [Bacteroidales bacterium]MCK9498339.1 RNA-binding S4 domain-containing protein [Bacteroidales bacterium]MDY0314503.1 RNA-binding S4 domain-containing protein [Bacteroidales bacterium]NLB85995.1 RNA-binding S4 domain-containing protein [Bacteroidales bacterium]